MAELTPNFKLTKPSPEDFYDINVQNDNMDIIDEELKKASEVAEKMTPEALGVYGYIDSIGGGADLNSYLTTGSYRCTSSDAATVKNSPITTMAFQLHVFKAADKESSSESTRPTIQFITAVNTNDYGLYWRKHSSGVWTKWFGLADTDSRTIKSYTELSQLGLTSSATIADIFNALPNGGELLLDVATHNAALYPLSQGTAHFTKRFGYRCFVEFYDYYGASNLTRIKRYYGLYNTSTGFSGWYQYYDSYNPQPVGTERITDFVQMTYSPVTTPAANDVIVYKIGNIIIGQVYVTMSNELAASNITSRSLFRIMSKYAPYYGTITSAMIFDSDNAFIMNYPASIYISNNGEVHVQNVGDYSGNIKKLVITFSYPCA